ncbi:MULTISPECIES: hypothetical protein [Streptomyces]|uniref:Uncharacterized protein n=1 Tax=Streptomyces venezuelae (strain ATCC 10712 / CBS 650.69 / DSM 40230 / JCM 4526 / NBRC 13096 / PD 04745) TaxID=953739 RepID=F2R4A4_STRVP|nr:hypothetical protein [Streptomyces venezuelae]APE19608.1 hypothetical protein vnz_00410 [Streptomyces venezuelae]QER97023.1 hypothetical protein DEJ43_00415 [Streptomyces venezuelae ATCC 10712]CCA53381.1 hypothetical protein SVEN_0093 [Streptomyces venezuelae ATCC 10712]
MLLPSLPRTPLRSSEQPTIHTPFGPLAFVTTIGNTTLPLRPDEQFQLPGDRTVSRWVTPGARVELLLTPHDPALDPEHWGPLTGCRAVVWRIDALTPLERVRFSAGLPEGTGGGYDGGQALAAITVEDETTRLTVGGSDEEAICQAADAGEVPRRWTALIDEVHDHSFSTWGVDYGDYHGMSWTLPPLEAGDHCELPVVAAWAPAADESANTWYAVMPSPTALLTQAAAAADTALGRENGRARRT